MACSNLTGGFTLDCNDSNGGIDKVFIANGAVESITETEGIITAITVAGSALTPADFFEFEVPRQTSSFTETINVSQENATVFYDQALTMVFQQNGSYQERSDLVDGTSNQYGCSVQRQCWKVFLSRR